MTPHDDFDEFFRATYPRLVAIGVSMSNDRAVAQELAQETLLRAHHNWDELRSYDQPFAWCRRVMSRLLIDHHRSRSAEHAALQRVNARAESTTRPQPDATTTWHELIAPLTPQQRLAATLYYGEDRSIDEVATTMMIAAGTVKSTLSKARRNLRRGLRDVAGDEEAQR